jgi:uncharacterized protein (TIGR03118 family)
MKVSRRMGGIIACLGLVIATAGQARAKHMGSDYVQTNLISDIPGLAQVTDPNLLNPWGLAFFPGASPFWINENNQPIGASALYFADAVPFPLLPSVTIPPPAVTVPPTPGAPTGIVANFFVGSGAFDIPDADNPLSNAGFDGPALFIFDTEDGTIEAWTIESTTPPISPGVPDPLIAEIVVDNSDNGSPTGAVYKGLALGSNTANGPLLYATNFRSGKIDVFDTNFQTPSPALTGSFTDPKVQNGYAPFGIQNINGQIWVTYAEQDKAKHDPVNKPGHGFVSVFDTDGKLLQHFAQHGHLDSPWGLVMAPGTFGQFANDILIGNFGDGVINAFDPKSGHWLGSVSGKHGRPLVNNSLWSLTFGGAQNSDGSASSADTLFFSAGLNDENDGLFGTIVPQ